MWQSRCKAHIYLLDIFNSQPKLRVINRIYDAAEHTFWNAAQLKHIVLYPCVSSSVNSQICEVGDEGHGIWHLLNVSVLNILKQWLTDSYSVVAAEVCSSFIMIAGVCVTSFPNSPMNAFSAHWDVQILWFHFVLFFKCMHLYYCCTSPTVRLSQDVLNLYFFSS